MYVVEAVAVRLSN